MKRKIKKIITIVSIIIGVWTGMFITDLVRTKRNQPPIFCISFADYDISEGYIKYTGLFYRVDRTLIEVDGNTQRKYELFPWFN